MSLSGLCWFESLFWAAECLNWSIFFVSLICHWRNDAVLLRWHPPPGILSPCLSRSERSFPTPPVSAGCYGDLAASCVTRQREQNNLQPRVCVTVICRKQRYPFLLPGSAEAFRAGCTVAMALWRAAVQWSSSTMHFFFLLKAVTSKLVTPMWQNRDPINPLKYVEMNSTCSVESVCLNYDRNPACFGI